MTDTAEWRLRATSRGSDRLDEVIRRLRGGGEKFLGATVGGTLPLGAALTRDGDTLFVYAPTRSHVESARSAVDEALRSVGRSADLSISRWDADAEIWHQLDPPLTGEARELHEARVRDATRPAMRTVTCTAVGRRQRGLLTSLADDAQGRGVQCSVTEERAWLRTRLTYTISGPAAKVEAFASYVKSQIDAMRQPAAGPGP